MSRPVLLLMLVVVVVLPAAALAKGAETSPFAVKLAYMMPSSGVVKDSVGNFFGIVGDFTPATSPVGCELGYLWAGKTRTFDTGIGLVDVKNTASVIPLMATYRHSFAEKGSSGSAAYGRIGAGIAFMNVDLSASAGDIHEKIGSENTTEFAWQMQLGMDFAEDWFGEVGYHDYGKLAGEGINGFQLAVGRKF